MCSNNSAQSKLFLFFIVGACDGMTYEEIEEEYPEEFEMREKDKLAYRYPRYCMLQVGFYVYACNDTL